MNTEIAVIATEYLREFLNGVLKELPLEMDYTLYTYTDFKDIPDVYRSIPERVNGVIASGIFPYRILRETFPDTRRIIRMFSNDDAGIYRLFLRLVEENRGLELSRIYADVVDVAGLSLREYLFGPRKLSYDDLLVSKLEDIPLDSLMTAEQEYRNRHLELWRAGEIDLSVTRFSSIAAELEGAGLKVYFPYPSFEYMHAVCAQTVQAVRMEELRANQSASIAIFCPTGSGGREDALEELRKAVARLNTVYRLNAVLRPVPQGYELLTKRSAVEEATAQFTTCRLQGFFQKRGLSGVYIGYGIGADLHQARINAIDAGREARRIAGGASALINERGDLICPLRGERSLVVSRSATDQVRQVAQLSGLSTLTVQKVFAAAQSMPTARMTSQELARALSVTQRSANRFLSALQRAGFAKIVDQKKDNTMGRPERIYEIWME